MSTKNQNTKPTEANVLLELLMHEAMSEEVLDANSDDVLDAVQQHAAHIALGPTISLNLRDCSIRLRFDLIAASESEAYRQVAAVLEAIETHTDLRVERSRSAVEVGETSEEPRIVC